METAVVDVLRAPEVQRLRRIRQLGLAHLVFPGAEHSRLVHVLGASHLAIRFTKRLQDSAEDFLGPELRPHPSTIRDVALAALCHDLGHGPLSHVWETEAIGHGFDRKAWADSLGLPFTAHLANLKWHELVGQALLHWKDGELHALLEEHEEGTSERIRHLLIGDYYLTYVPRILDSDVDVDRSDFILRDAHETGVLYGEYDLGWLLSSLAIGTTNNGLVVGFDLQKAPRVVEQFLVARRALYEMVYYHKTVRSAEGMIGLLLHRLKKVAAEFESKGALVQPQFRAYRKIMNNELLKIEDVLLLDDYSLWGLIQHLSENDVDFTVADLARRTLQRDLFKLVRCTSDALGKFMERKDFREQIEAVVGKVCKGDPGSYVHVDHVTLDMLEMDASKRAYFIDLSRPERPASPISEHPAIATHMGRSFEQWRVFVPREAVTEVQKLIAG